MKCKLMILDVLRADSEVHMLEYRLKTNTGRCYSHRLLGTPVICLISYHIEPVHSSKHRSMNNDSQEEIALISLFYYTNLLVHAFFITVRRASLTKPEYFTLNSRIVQGDDMKILIKRRQRPDLKSWLA